MKTTWYVKYEIINKPGIKTFDTLEEATLFARKIMRRHSEIPKYIGDVRKGNRKAFRGAVADFLKKYYSNPEFTSSVLVAYARAARRMEAEGKWGCYTVFDVPPAYLSPKTHEELIATLL